MKLQALAAAAVALTLAPAATLAQSSQFTPNGQNDITYRVNIPTSTSKSGSGPIYFQISAPTSDQWVGLGQGRQMRGANIFIMYAASDSNITLSPRSGEGEFQPLYNSDARISLLEGTGISNGIMTANVRCDNCLEWDGGSMDPTDTAAPWIWSVRSGPAIDSTSVSENLQIHEVMGQFSFDLVAATGGSSANPFSESEAETSSSSGATSISEESSSDVDTRREAHGAIMSVAFVVLLPVAALVLHLPIKIATVPLIHAPVQIIGLCLSIAGLGVGISLAQDTDNISDPVQEHVVIGIIVVSVLVLFQPAMGLLQHLHFRKTGGKSIFAFAHRWLGRCMIILGLINGGLGFRLSGVGTREAPDKAIIAYSVVAGMIMILYLGLVLFSADKDIKHPSNGGQGGEKLAMRNMNGSTERDGRDIVSSESGNGRLVDETRS